MCGFPNDKLWKPLYRNTIHEHILTELVLLTCNYSQADKLPFTIVFCTVSNPI